MCGSIRGHGKAPRAFYRRLQTEFSSNVVCYVGGRTLHLSRTLDPLWTPRGGMEKVGPKIIKGARVKAQDAAGLFTTLGILNRKPYFQPPGVPDPSSPKHHNHSVNSAKVRAEHRVLEQLYSHLAPEPRISGTGVLETKMICNNQNSIKANHSRPLLMIHFIKSCRQAKTDISSSRFPKNLRFSAQRKGEPCKGERHRVTGDQQRKQQARN